MSHVRCSIYGAPEAERPLNLSRLLKYIYSKRSVSSEKLIVMVWWYTWSSPQVCPNMWQRNLKGRWWETQSQIRGGSRICGKGGRSGGPVWRPSLEFQKGGGAGGVRPLWPSMKTLFGISKGGARALRPPPLNPLVQIVPLLILASVSRTSQWTSGWSIDWFKMIL